MRQPYHLGGTISSPRWNDHSTQVKRYLSYYMSACFLPEFIQYLFRKINSLPIN